MGRPRWVWGCWPSRWVWPDCSSSWWASYRPRCGPRWPLPRSTKRSRCMSSARLGRSPPCLTPRATRRRPLGGAHSEVSTRRCPLGGAHSKAPITFARWPAFALLKAPRQHVHPAGAPNPGTPRLDHLRVLPRYGSCFSNRRASSAPPRLERAPRSAPQATFVIQQRCHGDVDAVLHLLSTRGAPRARPSAVRAAGDDPRPGGALLPRRVDHAPQWARLGHVPAPDAGLWHVAGGEPHRPHRLRRG